MEKINKFADFIKKNIRKVTHNEIEWEGIKIISETSPITSPIIMGKVKKIVTDISPILKKWYIEYGCIIIEEIPSVHPESPIPDYQIYIRLSDGMGDEMPVDIKNDIARDFESYKSKYNMTIFTSNWRYVEIMIKL